MPSHCEYISILPDPSHRAHRVFTHRPLQTLRNHRAHPSHPPPPPNTNPFHKIAPNKLNGIDYDPPPLPRARAPRARNPLIRLPFTLRSLSQFHPLPRPTSPSPLSILPLKPVLIFMKSHAAPNFSPKPLFYPEGTPTPLATSRTPKHSRDPFPPSPTSSRPHTPSTRQQLKLRV